MYNIIKLIPFLFLANSKNTLTLKDALELDIVTFTFTKVMGSHRIATGTRNLVLIPDEFHPKGTGRGTPEGILTFFDWHKRQWRSCREDTIFGTWEIKNKDLLYRIDKYKELGIDP
jgi:hypothetical protein